MNSTDIPVIGWMVCVSGPDKGQEFGLIRNPNGNGIGSSESMAVVVRDDENVSAENHATIFFDENCQKSYVAPGFGKRIVRINDAIVFAPMYLKPYDVITIGETKFVFLPNGGNVEPNTTWVRVKNKQPASDVLSELKDCYVKPCVGWLIDRGMSRPGVAYRLTSDYNYIGPMDNSDIIVPPDATVMGNQYAAIVYDSKANSFFFVPLASNMSYFINGLPVNGVCPLTGYEEISMGMNRFSFVPLCGDYFRW